MRTMTEAEYFSGRDYILKIGNNEYACLDPHNHEFYECFVLLSGKFTHTINDKRVKMSQGDALLIEPGEVHFFDDIPLEKSPHVLVISMPQKRIRRIDDAWENKIIPGFGFEKSGVIHFNSTDFAELNANINLLNFSDKDNKDIIFSLIFNIIIRTLLKETYCSKQTTDDKRLDYAIKRMNEQGNMAEGIPAFVRLSNFSGRHLARLIYDKYGVSLYEYVTQLRMKYSANLLEFTDMKVLDIALNVGYMNLSNFTKQFKKYYKKTPNEYRKQFKGPNRNDK